jgi:hypothetical protein
VLPDEARAYAGYLRDLIQNDPDMRALLAASPEARRRLKPLWRMASADPLPDYPVARREIPGVRSRPVRRCAGAPVPERPGAGGPAPRDSAPSRAASSSPRSNCSTPSRGTAFVAKRIASPEARPARPVLPPGPRSRRIRRVPDWPPSSHGFGGDESTAIAVEPRRPPADGPEEQPGPGNSPGSAPTVGHRTGQMT